MASCEGPLKVLRVSANSLRSPCTVSSSNLRDFRGLESPLESRGLLARCARPQRGSCEAATEPLRSPMQGPHARPLRSPAKPLPVPSEICEATARLLRSCCGALARPHAGLHARLLRSSPAKPLRVSSEICDATARLLRSCCPSCGHSPDFANLCWLLADLVDFRELGGSFGNCSRILHGSRADAARMPRGCFVDPMRTSQASRGFRGFWSCIYRNGC